MTRTDVSAAVEAIVGRFSAMVNRVAWRHRLDDADVDELLQDLRIRLWRAFETGEQIEQLPTSYVYKTATSAALDMVRRRRAQREELSVSLDEGHGISTNSDPGQDAAESELVQHVSAAIEKIPASRRPVLRMHLAGYPREEIASLLGWSEAKVRNLLYRGLTDLREQLTGMGIGIGMEQTE